MAWTISGLVAAGWLAACGDLTATDDRRHGGDAGGGGGESPAVPIKPGDWWKPAPGLSWQIQYSGDLDLTLDVDVYNIDLFETPKSAIDGLRGRGVRVICYFGGGNWEQWRADSSRFPASVLGADIDGWPGEKWIDVRQIDILRPIMTDRMNIAREKGCDAVDPDVMDGWQAKTGFPLSYDDQIRYNRMIASEAHARGLAVSLKNDLEQIGDLLQDFDFAVNEECRDYNECDRLKPFIAAGKPVFGIQYTGDPVSVCPGFNALGFDSLFKRLNLDAYRVDCRSVTRPD